MATLAPLTTPTRQPFGLITDNKLRQLQSIKNRQNALTASSAPSLKRRAPSPDISDSENVDPNLLDTIDKRKKAAFESDVSCSKPSRYSLEIVSKPRLSQSIATPRLDTLMKTSTTPASAPPSAGRSPTRPNRHGVLPPKRKLVPPSFGIKGPTLSIAAALNGTLAGKKRGKARTIENSKPKSWFFDIYEEPEQVQNDRMNEWTLSQDTSFLDVSDDERKGKEQTDCAKDNKENIDPNEVSAPVTRSMAAAKAAADDLKKDLMTDDRSPLSDLDPVEYYAPGLDATSVVLVQDEVAEAKETPESNDQILSSEAKTRPEFTFVAPSELAPVGDDILVTEDIGVTIAASAPATWETTVDSCHTADLPLESGADIEIWESESAKDENEKREGSVDDSVFALQEV